MGHCGTVSQTFFEMQDPNFKVKWAVLRGNIFGWIEKKLSEAYPVDYFSDCINCPQFPSSDLQIAGNLITLHKTGSPEAILITFIYQM